MSCQENRTHERNWHGSPPLPGAGHYGYVVRVRGGSNYLWGSDKIIQNLTFATPLILHIHNDEFGQTITFGTETANGATNPYGTLLAGQFVSIPLQDLRGVYASCASHSTVRCLIKIS
jgi:hypothetical protein